MDDPNDTEVGPPVRRKRDTLTFPASGAGTTTGLRLPPECRFWNWTCSNGGQLQYRYGQTVVLSEVLPPGGAISLMHVYPGDGCYIEFSAPAGSTIIVNWTW